MNAGVRRKLDLGAKVVEFTLAHPFTEPASVAVATRLEEKVAHGKELVVQQRTGQLGARSANARRNKIRFGALMTLLRLLVRVAEVAAKELPELAGRIKLPPQDGSHQAFLAAATMMVAEAASHRELLVKHGLAESLLDDLDRALAEYEAAANGALGAARARVTARLELKRVATEMVEIIKILDALNRYRFRDEEQLLGAWLSASNVLGPFRTAVKPDPGPPAQGGTKSVA